MRYWLCFSVKPMLRYTAYLPWTPIKNEITTSFQIRASRLSKWNLRFFWRIFLRLGSILACSVQCNPIPFLHGISEQRFFQFSKISNFPAFCLQFFKKTAFIKTHFGFSNWGSETLISKTYAILNNRDIPFLRVDAICYGFPHCDWFLLNQNWN